MSSRDLTRLAKSNRKRVEHLRDRASANEVFTELAGSLARSSESPTSVFDDAASTTLKIIEARAQRRPLTSEEQSDLELLRGPDAAGQMLAKVFEKKRQAQELDQTIKAAVTEWATLELQPEWIVVAFSALLKRSPRSRRKMVDLMIDALVAHGLLRDHATRAAGAINLRIHSLNLLSSRDRRIATLRDELMSNMKSLAALSDPLVRLPITQGNDGVFSFDPVQLRDALERILPRPE